MKMGEEEQEANASNVLPFTPRSSILHRDRRRSKAQRRIGRWSKRRRPGAERRVTWQTSWRDQ